MAKVKSSHYSLGLSPEKLRNAVILQADAIEAQENDGVPILLFSGFSGSAHAVALSLELHSRKLKFHMAYVRKPEERSHGDSIEHTMRSTVFPYKPQIPRKFCIIFVDDLISSGTTQVYCVSRFKERFNIKRDAPVYNCLAETDIDAEVTYAGTMNDIISRICC